MFNVNQNHFWKDLASTMKIDFKIQVLEAIFLKYVDFWPKYINSVSLHWKFDNPCYHSQYQKKHGRCQKMLKYLNMQKQNVSKQKIMGIIINKKDMKILVAGILFFLIAVFAFSFRTIIIGGPQVVVTSTFIILNPYFY